MDEVTLRPSEMGDREIRREARARMKLIVTHEVLERMRKGQNVSADDYHSALLRLTMLRAEARRRAALN